MKIMFIDKVFYKKRKLIIEEEDLTKVLSIVNINIPSKYKKKMEIDVYKSIWFVGFKASNNSWTDIIENLESVKYKLIPPYYQFDNDYFVEKVES